MREFVRWLCCRRVFSGGVSCFEVTLPERRSGSGGYCRVVAPGETDAQKVPRWQFGQRGEERTLRFRPFTRAKPVGSGVETRRVDTRRPGIVLGDVPPSGAMDPTGGWRAGTVRGRARGATDPAPAAADGTTDRTSPARKGAAASPRRLSGIARPADRPTTTTATVP